MTVEQWSAYRALSKAERERYRAARMSGVKHKVAMKRAKTELAKPKGFARMTAVARPVGV